MFHGVLGRLCLALRFRLVKLGLISRGIKASLRTVMGRFFHFTLGGGFPSLGVF